MVLLKVRDLHTYYYLPFGAVQAVDGVSFNLKERETLGMAGESGCGKTTLAFSILRLIKPPGKIVAGEILFKRKKILELDQNQLRNLRWQELSIVFQQSMYTLNPMMRISDQMVEAVTLHTDLEPSDAKIKAGKLLELVGLEKSRLRNYPHELSGGMRQRVIIAMALICEPDLVILDEPTTALDVVVQHKIIQLIDSLKKRLNLSVIWITHDLSVLSEVADRIAVMYAGKIAEIGEASHILSHPNHPYSKALLDAVPVIDKPNQELNSIPGSPPNLVNPPNGCRFSPRCKYSIKICQKTSPKQAKTSRGYIECHLWKEINGGISTGE